jgi:hypothetical protein
VAWGGDVNLGRRQHYRVAELGGPQAMLGNIAALRDADLRIVNLECVVATTGEQGADKDETGAYYYRARPEMIDVLTAARIDLVSTANNHSGDYGPQALLEQKTLLDAAGIGSAGTGPDLEAALQPVMARAGEVRVALFSLDATQPKFAATAWHPGGAYLPLATPPNGPRRSRRASHGRARGRRGAGGGALGRQPGDRALARRDRRGPRDRRCGRRRHPGHLGARAAGHRGLPRAADHP